LKLNEIHYPLSYPDDINVLDENINTIKRNTEYGLEVNTQTNKHMVVSHYQMLDKILIYSLLINSLRMWKSSST